MEKGLTVQMNGITVGGDVQITQDTIVSYQVAVAEEQMEKRAAELQEEIDGLNKVIETISKEVQKAIEKQVEQDFGVEIKKVNKIFQSLTGDNKKEFLKVSGELDGAGKICVKVGGEDTYRDFCAIKDASPNKQCAELIEDQAGAQSDVNKKYSELGKVNLALSRVDRMQRQASKQMMDNLAKQNPELRKLLNRSIGKGE